MGAAPDFIAWGIGILAVALFGFFFWHTGRTLVRLGRQLIATIQHWPQTRRTMTEAEAQSGGRYPWWFRAIRVALVVTAIGLGALLVWRKATSG
jgi:hypothetical protein